eukprot:361905-Chlamydomonas_euryale.AAC.6
MRTHAPPTLNTHPCAGRRCDEVPSWLPQRRRAAYVQKPGGRVSSLQRHAAGARRQPRVLAGAGEGAAGGRRRVTHRALCGRVERGG